MVQAGVLGAADPVLDAGMGAVPGLELGELADFGVGGEGLEPPAGHLGDVRAGAEFAVGFDRGCPRLLGQRQDRGLDRGGHGEPDREPQVQTVRVAQLAEMGEPGFGGAGTVGADQDRRSVPMRVGIWASARSVTVVWSAAVLDPELPGRSRVASASPVLSHHGRQRVEAVAALERRRRRLLVAVGGDQGGVELDLRSHATLVRPQSSRSVAGRPRRACSQTRSWAAARADRRPASSGSSTRSRTRQAVAVEATGPNRSGMAGLADYLLQHKARSSASMM